MLPVKFIHTKSTYIILPAIIKPLGAAFSAGRIKEYDEIRKHLQRFAVAVFTVILPMSLACILALKLTYGRPWIHSPG